MSDRRRSRRWQRRLLLVAIALAATGIALGGTAEASRALVTAAPTEGLQGGDRVRVNVSSVEAGRFILAAQCANVPGVPAEQRCGPWIGAAPTAGGTVGIDLTVLAGRVGQDPRAVCPTPEGECVVRIVQSGPDDVRSVASSLMEGSAAQQQPSPDSTLVQEVTVRIEKGDEPAGTTTTTRPTVEGSVVTVPIGGGPTVDGSAGAPGTDTGVRELATTGLSSTLLLTALAVALIDLGWLARTARPRDLGVVTPG